MGTLRFPLHPVRSMTPVDGPDPFPADPSGLHGGRWREFLAEYDVTSSGSAINVVAPDDCMVYLVHKAGAEYLLALEPLAPSRWQSGFLRSREPLVSTWLLGFDALADSATRLAITREVILLNFRRGMATAEIDDRGLPISINRDWLADEAAAGAYAEPLLSEWERGMFGRRLAVKKGERLHTLRVATARVRVGASHVARERGIPVAAPWYWFDVHTLLQRLTVESRFADSPIPGTPGIDPLRAWYELASLAPHRIRLVESATPRVRIHNPRQDGDSLPPEVFELGPADDEPVTAEVPAAGSQWSVRWSVDASPWRTVGEQSLGTAAAQELVLSDIPHDFGRRVEPLYVQLAVASGSPTPIIRFQAERDLVGLAEARSGAVLRRGRELEQFLAEGDNTMLVELDQKLDLVINNSPEADADPLKRLLRSVDDRPDTDRRNDFRSRFGAHTDRLDRAVRALGDVLGQELVEQVVDRDDPAALAVLKRAVHALEATPDGANVLKQRSQGFLFPDLRPGTAGEPIFNASLFVTLWKRSRSQREALASSLLEFSKADLYLSIVGALRAETTNDPAATAAALRAFTTRFTVEFGELESVIVRTDDITITRGRYSPRLTVPTFRFEERAEPGLRTASRQAGQLGRALEGLHLLEDYVKLVVALRAYDTTRRTRGDLEAIQDFVGLTGSAASLVQRSIDYYELLGDRYQSLRFQWTHELRPTSGWGVAAKGAGLVGGVLSLAGELREVGSRHVDGDHTRGNWLAVAAVGSAISVGLSVAGVMAWNPPAAAVIGSAAAVIAFIGHLGAAEFGFTPLQLDVVHTFWGDQYDELPGAPRRDQHEWHPAAGVHNLALQIGHLNGHVFPIRDASMRLHGDVVPSPQLVVLGRPARALEGSLVVLQLWRHGFPPRLTFLFELELGMSRTTSHGAFTYSADQRGDGTIDVAFYFDAPAGRRIAGLEVADLDRATLAFSMQPSPRPMLAGRTPVISDEELARVYAAAARTYLRRA